VKLSQASVLGHSDFPGENENFYNLLDYTQQFCLEVRDLSRKNVTFDENVDNQLIGYEFTDMVTASFRNDLNHKPTEILSATAQSQMIVGYQLEFLQSGLVNITLKFLNAGSKSLCKVRIT